MKKQLMDIDAIYENPNNPRIIKDVKFRKLVDSIKQFPEMLEIRPIVVNEDMIVLGGNMRLKASVEAGLKKVWVLQTSLTEEQQKEFIIKDNIGFGEWDWDVLANEWDATLLNDWGLGVWENEETIDFGEQTNFNDNELNSDEKLCPYCDKQIKK